MKRLLEFIFGGESPGYRPRYERVASEPEVQEEMLPLKMRQELFEFVRRISSHLPAADSARFVSSVKHALHDTEVVFATDALVEGITEAQHPGAWLMFYVDCRDIKEGLLQVEQLLLAHAIAPTCPPVPSSSRYSVATMLDALSNWLTGSRYCLLHLDTAGTEYCAFMIPAEKKIEFIELGGRAGLALHDAESFRVKELEP